MLKIRTSASTSNLGPGFDCLGLALNIYNEFQIEPSDSDRLFNLAERFNRPDNIFLTSYHKAMEKLGYDDHIAVTFSTDVPVARGLGSSSTLIVAAITAAFLLHDKAFDKDAIFQLAAQIEGHPDNAAPCVYGGFTASYSDGNSFLTQQLQLNDSWKFTAFIPDFEISTEKARAILPDTYSRKTAVSNSAKAILTVDALQKGDLTLLKKAAKDEIHEPYRKTLIPEFSELEDIFTQDTGGILLISGSGSTCLGIAKQNLNTQAIKTISQLKNSWQIKEVQPDFEGVRVL